MSRNFIYKILGALVVLAAAVFWILSLTMPETFGAFSLAWAGVLLCGGIVTTVKKLKIWFGVALIVCAILCLVSALTIPENLVIPIIAVVVAVGFMITILATAGKKWDEGDNHKAGYKNYHERKKEEEKQEDKDNK